MNNHKLLLKTLLGSNVVRYYPALAEHVGGAKAALMLSQLLYWDSRDFKKLPGGWFWVGGVCPMDITMLSGVAHAGVDMSTAGGVAAGLPIGCEVDTSVVAFDGGDMTFNHCGYSFVDDA